MEDIPSEFWPYASFIIAAETVKQYNPIAAQVLTQVFVDICQDYIQTTTSKKAQEFLTNLSNNLPEFPRDGPDETKLLADDLYDSICSSLRSGKLNTHIAQQFWLCGILYSVLAGDESEKRERICKITAARLKMILAKAEIKKAPPARSQSNKDSSNKSGNNKMKPPSPANGADEVSFSNLVASTKPNAKLKQKPASTANKSPMQQFSASMKPSKATRPPASSSAPPTYESVMSHYSEKKAIEYLKSIGVNIPSSIPKLNDNFRPSIAQNLDLSLSCLAQNDTKQAKLFLQKAQKSWRAGNT